MSHVLSRNIYLVISFFVVSLLNLNQVQAAEVSIPNTQMVISVPDNYKQVKPQNAPNILLQYDAPSGDSSLQVIAGITGKTDTELANNYESKMRPAFKTMKKVEELAASESSGSLLFRRYEAAGDGIKLDIQAVFMADDKQPLVIHALSQGNQTAVMRTALIGLHGSISWETRSVNGTDIQLDVPSSFLEYKEEGGSPVIAHYHSPEEDISVQVLQSKQTSTDKIIDSYETAMQQGFNPFSRIANETITLNGQKVTLHRYKGTSQGLSMDITAIFLPGTPGFAIHVMSTSDKASIIQRIIMSVNKSAVRSQGSNSDTLSSMKLPESWEIAGSVPAGWNGNTKGNLVKFQGTGKLLIRVQQFNRTGAHSSLDASAAEAVRQIKAAPSVKVVDRGSTTVAGLPAQSFDLAYELNGSPERMIQVIISTKSKTYWISYSGSIDIYQDHLAEFQSFVYGLTSKDAG